MGFKENLLKKMEIDRVAAQITASLGTPDSGRRIDKAQARKFLAEAGYEKVTARDLELYRLPPRNEKARILVLDNDLPIYATTPEDVTLRKSPIVKEMLNIRNVFKILNDSDVLLSKKGDSVQTVREEIIAGLDLTFEPADIEAIYNDGRASIESQYAEGLEETLQIFAELLGWSSPPAVLRQDHSVIIGRPSKPPGAAFGPAVVFNRMHFTLMLIRAAVVVKDEEALAHYRQVVTGAAAADATGHDVLAYLRDLVLSSVNP
ncbi:MAG: hypothetical protein PVF97_04280 [Desulfobacterales bacterium]|jgi:hypothetical protein